MDHIIPVWLYIFLGCVRFLYSNMGQAVICRGSIINGVNGGNACKDKQQRGQWAVQEWNYLAPGHRWYETFKCLWFHLLWPREGVIAGEIERKESWESGLDEFPREGDFRPTLMVAPPACHQVRHPSVHNKNPPATKYPSVHNNGMPKCITRTLLVRCSTAKYSSVLVTAY